MKNVNVKMNIFREVINMFANVPALGEVANFGTDYFLSKIKFLARNKREFTTKFAILPNACVCPAYAGHTPKAFQIVQKYKF